MDTLKKYQSSIIAILNKHAVIKPANMPNIENQVIADTLHNHFQLLSLGWQDNRFVFHCVFHFDIKDGKIWIQQNWTDVNIAEELEELGVPKSDIVLGFQPEFARPYTGYGVK